MKNTKKILLLFIFLAFGLLLTSCKKQDTTQQFAFYELESKAELVKTELDTGKHVSGTSFYYVDYSGNVTKASAELIPSKIEFLIEGEDNVSVDNITSEQLSSAYAKKYIYSFELYDKKGKKIEIPDVEIVQLKKNSEDVKNVTYVDYVSFDTKNKLTRSGAAMTTTYIFTGEDLEFYNINSKGEINEVSLDKLTFTDHPNEDNILPEGEKQYVNHKNFVIKGSYDKDDFEFVVRLAATYKPLNPKTASFWNWIFLQMPIAYLMAFISKLFNNSFAMGIIITTIIVRTLAWPIYAKTNDMSMKMSIAQPDLDRLNKKYATRKDPESQQKMQMEMMQIYKKHGINMFGCLLPFLQMPIFFAMFEVVRRITIPGGTFYESVKNTKFFFTDLNQHGTIAKLVFTALVGITMFVLQKFSTMKPSYVKQSPAKQANPQAQQQEQTMKMVSFFMIFMMIMTSFVTPGLALSYYWIIGNIYSIGQTLLNRHLNEIKYKKLQEEKLYGKSKEIIDAEFKKKGDK